MRDGSQEGLKIIDVKGKSGNIDKNDVLCAKLEHAGLECLCTCGLGHEC